MQATKYIWHNGQFVNWEDAKVHILTHTLHYGGGAFEGIRFYETNNGAAIFKLGEHIDRLIFSAKALAMQLPYTKDELINVCKELLKKNEIKEGYIRPIAFYGYGTMTVNPVGASTEVAIACWPWGAYLPHPLLKVKTSKYIRIHPQSTVAEAKLCGHYINCILANLELRGTEYHEAIFLTTDNLITEGSGENFFIIKNGTLYTPKLGWILPGITRDTLLELARFHAIPIVEKDLTLDDAYTADEAFFTGTAAEVTPIYSIDQHVIKDGHIGPITQKLQKHYHDVVRGNDSNFIKHLTFV